MIKPDYPSVLLIYTGGTIGMIENPATGALEAFNFDRERTGTETLQLPHLFVPVYAAYRLFGHGAGIMG